MSRYQELARRAWLSGEYRLPGPASAPSREEGWMRRELLRSKMEWIVEREACPHPRRAPETGEGEKPMKLAQFVKFREEKFGGVIFETRSEKVFTLSPTGAAVVKEILAGADGAEAVVARLKEKFQDPSGALESEARAFIASLRERGLLSP